MGFPFVTAFYKNTNICNFTSRSKGYNIHNSSNNPSYCAEYRVYRLLSQKCPDAIKNKGRKLLILIDINGFNSKPCLICKKFYTKNLPLCKMKYKENGTFVTNNPSNIENSIYSKGVKVWNKTEMITNYSKK
tara:strand:+ start:540 stop:935 length:396 start_codon:yes stop_codon:yes gene_type:complete